MSQPLSHDSRYRPAAAKFGAALDRRMRERRIGAKTLGPQCKVAVSAIGMYRGALNIPSLQVAQRLADALDAPELLAIVEAARTKQCRRCNRTFVATHHVSRYCSIACRTLGAPGTQRSSSKPEQAVQILRGELLRVGAVRKQSVGQALTLLDDVLEPVRQAVGLTEVYSAAVEAMCRECEPEGLCRNVECPLRPVSPLPVAGDKVDVARPAAGLWGKPGMREHMAAKMREAHRRNPAHRVPFLAAGQRLRDQRRVAIAARARIVVADVSATAHQRRVAQALVDHRGSEEAAGDALGMKSAAVSQTLRNAEKRVAA